MNAFALMGLRQLYFPPAWAARQTHLPEQGPALILLFIGIKLILEAAHEVFGLNIPSISAFASLAFIIVVLIITAVASIVAVNRNPNLVASPLADKTRQEDDNS